MTLWVASACLLSGALLSLLASIGVLRLPDVFMRMHAATKSGVVGCGLVLTAVAIMDGSTTTGLKVAVAIAFLLLTTPIAGHLLGRAAYVSGAPFWPGTVDDQLASVMQRRHFGSNDLAASPKIAVAGHTAVKGIDKVVIVLDQGPRMRAAIKEAIALAEQHRAELCGIAVIDAPRLTNVGPVPAGAGTHAADLRKWRLGKARQSAADMIQIFESHAEATNLRWSVCVEEGRPHTILQTFQEAGTVVAIAPGGGFDQGVLQEGENVVQRLVDKGVYPLLIMGQTADDIDRIRFVHDGSSRSFNTWLWLLESHLWPDATLLVSASPDVDFHSVEQAVQEARMRGRRVEQVNFSGDTHEYVVIGNAGSRSWLPGWMVRKQSTTDEKVLAVG